MKERPILFSGSMVRATLEGRKTQTRRVVKWPSWIEDTTAAVYHLQRSPEIALFEDGRPKRRFGCPYGQPGDRLWVRETFHTYSIKPVGEPMKQECVYRADPESDGYDEVRWTPSIFMPRKWSRITLEITGVRVERINQISNDDILREGIRSEACNSCVHYGGSGCNDCTAFWGLFRNLWNSINAKRGHSWESNPWVWVIELNRLEQVR